MACNMSNPFNVSITKLLTSHTDSYRQEDADNLAEFSHFVAISVLITIFLAYALSTSIQS